MNELTVCRPKRNFEYLLVFLLAFVPRCLLLGYVKTISIGGDELFAMWPAAKLFGYHWEGVMQDYRYYGFGFSALITPVLAVFRDPVTAYRVIVFLMILAQSAAAPVCCHLMKRYLHVDDQRIRIAASVVCAYFVAVRAVYSYSEFIYVFLVWLCVWVLLDLYEEDQSSRRKRLDTLLLMLLLTAAFSVHSRALALWIALAGTAAIQYWISRRCVVSLPVMAVSGILGYLFCQTGIRVLLAYLGDYQAQSVGNTSVELPASLLSVLKDPKSWRAWLNIVIGQLCETMAVSAGLALGILAAALVPVGERLKSRRAVLSRADDGFVSAGIFCALAAGITIAGLAFSWLPGVVAADEGVGSPDSYRAITYFRYYGAYMGPLVMLGIARLAKKPDCLQKIKGKVLAVGILLEGYWIFCILPVIYQAQGCCWSYAVYSFTRGFADPIRLRTYLPGTLAAIAGIGAGYWLYSKGKQKILLYVLAAVLIWAYFYNGIYHEGYRGDQNYRYSADAAELVEYLEEYQAVPDVIYVEENYVPQGGQELKYLYQYLMPKQQIRPGFPDGEDKTGIYFCIEPSSGAALKEAGYRMGKVSENTWVYVLGKEQQRLVEAYGISLQ